MDLASLIASPEVSSQSLGRVESAVRDLITIRGATVPRAIFDGQLLSFAEELVPLLHDSRYLGVPELASRWNAIVKIVSGWYEATQEDEG
jgi:hypothetical protein